MHIPVLSVTQQRGFDTVAYTQGDPPGGSSRPGTESDVLDDVVGWCRHLVKAGLLTTVSAETWSLGIPTLHTFNKTFNIGRKALLTVITKCKDCEITEQVL